jgi:hypothetical protein
MLTGSEQYTGAGVKVNVNVPSSFVLIIAGLHVPVIPFIETAGRIGAALFWHIGPNWANSGVISGVISIIIETVSLHCPAEGVNVYVNNPSTFVSITTGFHVPVIPLVETKGSAGGRVFWQSGPIEVNVGVTTGKISISISITCEHCPESGVNL